MQYIADFHIHSKYSRATSKNMDVDNLNKWAKIKGIDILGTGDFTHPLWLKELKEKLEPAESGLFKLKIHPVIRQGAPSNDGANSKEVRFILTSEISSIYSKGGKVRKIHNLIFAPSFEAVEKINTHLGWIGNLKSDGRPILGLDSKELAKIVFNISEDCMIIPAHCLLPNTYLHSNPGIKMIKDISVGDKVYTHKGRLKKVEKIYKRPYQGKIYNIRPYYFRLGLKTTSEHPFYAIRTNKICLNVTHTICKPICAYKENRKCTHEYYKNYQPQWIRAKDIEKGDILIFPRFIDRIKDIKEIRLSEHLKKDDYRLDKNNILPLGSRIKKLPNVIKINKEFCRLAGYYLAEGYTDNRDSISFCFNRKEKRYIKDLKYLMEKIFRLSSPRIYKREGTQGIEIIYFSKILAKVFSRLFYNNSKIRRAHTKCLPSWTLNLPLEKQVEILIGWWRGDKGYTVSRELMNQMKIIMLRLGIIPSIGEEVKEKFNKKEHKIGDRIIKAGYNLFSFSNLSFFEDKFNLLKEPEFKKFNTKLKRRHGWIDKKYIYIPVRDIEVSNYRGDVYNLEVKEDNSYVSEFATIHNCWTPWFSIFGSKSGFDSIEECFEEYSKYIYALETGLSSDPSMNWQLSALDNITLISNSDAHSLAKIGREVNIFEGEKIDYNLIRQAIINGSVIRQGDSLKLVKTIEFFPEEGKYHWDGHRNCEICLSPEESAKYNNICPRCNRPLTIGVMNRVQQLADRKVPTSVGIPTKVGTGRVPFQKMIPLSEIIADVLGMGVATKGVEEHYKNLIRVFHSEFKVLLDVKKEEIANVSLPGIAEGVERVRQGKVSIEPGYDGEFGKISIFGDDKEKPKTTSGQEILF